MKRPWVVSLLDLVTVLNVYIPNLEVLNIDNMFSLPAKNLPATRQLHHQYTGHLADIVCKAPEDNSAVEGAALTKIEYQDPLASTDKIRLGFTSVEKEVADKYSSYGYQVYTLASQDYIC